MNSRVVITGLNVLTPLCRTKDEFADCLYHRPPAKMIAKKAVDLNALVEKPKKVRRMNRVSLGAFLSVGKALEDRKLSVKDYNPFDVGCIISATTPSMDSTIDFLTALYNDGPDYTSPIAFSNTVANSCLAAVAVNYNLKGPSNLLLTANSLHTSYSQIKNGKSSIIISGSYEDMPDCKFTASDNLNYTNSFNNGTCIPYSESPRGICVKEQYVSLVCERADSQYINFDTPVYCEILGFGMSRKHTADVLNSQDDFYAEDFEKAMSIALAKSSLQAERIDAVIGAAGEHISLDKAEAAAISRVFGKQVPVISIKGIFGDAHSSNFNLNVSAAAVIFENGILPAAYNCKDCGGLINTVKENIVGDYKYILVNGYCEYGNVMSCVLKRYEKH
jgi:3-oxoacyl-(acyl-carrier-protein) synthase